jgi:hypothetical protein
MEGSLGGSRRGRSLRFDWSNREVRARRAEECTRRAFEEATARWEPDAQRLRELIETAQTLGTEDAPTSARGCPVALKRGETAFYWLSTVSLIETGLERDHCKEDYSEFSLHVLRNVDWQTGATRESSEAGTESPSVIDVGSVTITNQRVVFQGSKHARVWTFSRLLGIKDDTKMPWTAFAVTKQQKVFGLLYTEEEAEEFRFRLHLARAVQAGNRQALVVALERERVQHDAVRPVPEVPGVQDPMMPAVRSFTVWPRWARIGASLVVLLMVGLIGAAAVGRANSTFDAQSPLSSFLRATRSGAPVDTTPGAPVTTTRRPTTRVAPTGRRTTQPAATGPQATDVGVTPLPPAGSAASARPARRKGRPHSRPTSSPPTMSPPTTSPPTTEPPTTSPPTTEPPTTSPPTTEPPTTSPPTTNPPEESVEPGASCSQLGATAYTSDGALAVCVSVDVSLLDLRWVLA